MYSGDSMNESRIYQSSEGGSCMSKNPERHVRKAERMCIDG